MLTNTMAIIILQYINVSNQHVHLILYKVMCQLSLSKIEKKKKKDNSQRHLSHLYLSPSSPRLNDQNCPLKY